MKKTIQANRAKKAKKPAIKVSDLEPKMNPKGGPINHPGRT